MSAVQENKMAENDIYNSELKYENFKVKLDELTTKPRTTDKRVKYYCKNPLNIKHFRILFNMFETKDLSFIRRNRIIQTVRLITFATAKDLAICEREDIDEIVRFVNKVYSSRTRGDFIKDLKYIWKTLFPETDEKGRKDDTLIPYVVRHLNSKMDRSREKLRNDRINWDEFEKLVNYFNNDPRMQAFLTVSLESLSRPQELLYTKIKGVELYDNYAKIWITEHGKEGTKFLTCIDSFPFLAIWLNQHPFKHEKDCYLFIKYDKSNAREQLNPKIVNDKIRLAVRNLKIDKNVTCYSLKRAGVTFRRLRGDSDVEIQHTAGWSSTKMLKVYDKSQQDDIFRLQLIKKGLIKDKENKYPQLKMEAKNCLFCSYSNKFTDEICINCKRPLDRDKIIEQEKKRTIIDGKMNKLLEQKPEIFEIIAEARKKIQSN